MNTVKKIRPALYELSELPWAWVKLPELAEVVGMEIPDLWEQFKHLSIYSIYGKHSLINIAWGNDQDYEMGMYEEDLAELPTSELDTAFVPAGWANSILNEIKKSCSVTN